MKKIQAFLILILLIAVQVAVAKVIDFKTWKNEQIQRASGKAGDRIQLEAAQTLTIEDYMILYLSQQSDPNAAAEAAKLLKEADVTELLESYKKVLAEKKDCQPPSVVSGLRNQTPVPAN